MNYRRTIIIIGATIGSMLVAIIITIAYLLLSRQDLKPVANNDDESISTEIANLDNQIEKTNGNDARMSLLSTKIETYKSVGKYDEALTVAQQLDREFPDNASYKADIARIYELKGDSVNAVSYWRQAIDDVQKLPQTDESAAEKSYYEERLSYAEGSM